MTRQKYLFCYMMLAPALIITGALGIYPMIYSLWMSFVEFDLLRIAQFGTPFVGLDNYVAVFGDPRFIQTVVNTILFTVLAVAATVGFGLLLSQVLNATYPGRAVVRMMVCVPWFVPPAVASAIWMWLLHTDRSPVNFLLQDMGLITSNLRFLTDSSTWGPFSLPMLSITAVRVWNGLPFAVIFILAALQSIPRSLYEAAEVDGATLFQKFWYVTLPSLRPILAILLTLLVIGGLGSFEINYIMTGGGPQNLTNIMAVYSYQQAFSFYRFDLASAASGVILIMTGFVSVFYLRSQFKRTL
ncbi:carbohydrate ABC transporter permease [Devosia nitrariae]|uniref:Sugar ABC transporter permease n=1 Tax=Devosia nitrariae TaxID=2071872 RepID=A0ABQ5W717_9HYPH|nr:sugar ABC transporter permease [Devosia nitrariae]GLQ55405.1 sugar ABC transporter permease [Devosia nitrariae]